FLLLGWVVYNEMCKRISPNMERDGLLSIGVAIMMVVVAYLSTQMFSGRAAFLLTGAVMATAMSANVFFWIIPGQRRIVKAMKAGETPNPLDGKRGKQRSVHNTYFTLPVVLLMISNHYSFAYSHAHAWVIMALLIFAGALIRQYFVLMHAGKIQPGYPAVGVLLIMVAFWIGMPSSQQINSNTESGPDIADVQMVIEQRCVACHAQSPSQPGFSAPPAGFAYDNLDQILHHKESIQQVVASGYMPLGNMTNMSDEERALIQAWSE
ncbi:urate hydroxylase PuuD, partial [Halomonas sp. TD01]